MKLDSESTYHHPYPNEHTPKVIVHNGNHFVLPKDNHFMVDMLDIDESSKEGIYGVESPNEYDSCKVILPPKQHGIPNMEHFINRNNNEYDILKSSYSGSNPEIGLVVKEDFYANKAVAKVDASEEMVINIDDGYCHRVENMSEGVHSLQNSFVDKQEVGEEASFSSNKSSNNDNCNVKRETKDTARSPDFKYEEGVHSFQNSLVEKQEVGQEASFSSNKSSNNDNCVVEREMKDTASSPDFKYEEGVHSFQNSFVEKQEVGQEASFSSNKSSNNDNCIVEREMKDTASSPDFKYEVVDSDPITVARYPADVTSIIRNSAESCSCVSTIEGEDKLDTAELVKCDVSEGGDKLDTSELVRCNVLEGGYKLDTNDSIASDSSDKVSETELPASEELEKKSLQVDSSSLGLQVDSSSLGCSDDQRQSIDILNEVTEKHLLPSEELNKETLQVDSSSLGCSDDQKQSMDIIDEVTEKQLPPSEELNRDSLQVDSSSLGCSDDQKQSIDRSQNDQAIFEEKNYTATNVPSAAKDSVLSDESKEVLSSCKVPTEVITFTFDPQVTSISGKDKNRDSQQPKQAHIAPRTEAASSDGVTTSARRSLRNLVQGDSNLNGPGFLSGPIANSGHIPYSGSISLRSDSSTTSTRSFAFPILHSEWNSSPVKMAKATRRRGWRTGLLCCRF